MDGAGQYGPGGSRSGRGAAPDLVPPGCHSPSLAERCAYTPPSARHGFRERTPPPEQLLYTPPAERCATQPRSAAIKQLATFGGRASPPPPEEAGMLV